MSRKRLALLTIERGNGSKVGAHMPSFYLIVRYGRVEHFFLASGANAYDALKGQLAEIASHFELKFPAGRTIQMEIGCRGHAMGATVIVKKGRTQITASAHYGNDYHLAGAFALIRALDRYIAA